MKTCAKCGIEKPESEFSPRSDTGGLRHQCKECVKERNKIYHEAHKEEDRSRCKIYYETHKEERALRDKIYYEAHKEETTAQKKIYRETHKKESAAYREAHKEEKAAHDKIYYEENKDKIIERAKEYTRNRWREDTDYRIKCDLRSRTRHALKSGKKAGSAVRDLGCSIPELKKHFESKFRDGMTWENHGSVWEIDHIKPLSSFDLADREQFLEACRYTNLQPLLVSENRRKGAKYDG